MLQRENRCYNTSVTTQAQVLQRCYNTSTSITTLLQRQFRCYNGVINLNLAEETRKLGFTQGKYITVTNTLQSILSGNVYIDEISPSRKEIRIRPVDGRFQEDYFNK